MYQYSEKLEARDKYHHCHGEIIAEIICVLYVAYHIQYLKKQETIEKQE